MDDIKSLGHDQISKLIIRFSVPAIIGMLVMASYNIVDRIFVGRGVGALAISGIAVTFPLIIIFMGFGLLVGIGSSALVSIRLGEKKIDDAEKIIANAFLLSLIIGTLLTILGFIFMRPMLILFGASSEVLPYAESYTSVLLFGTIFQSLGFSLNNTIRGQGKPKTAMVTIASSAIINAILNPIFIFGLHLGIRGSALATVLAQFITACLVLGFYFSKYSIIKIKWHNLKLRTKYVFGIFSIGVSPFAMQIASSAIIMIFNRELEFYGGDLAIAAMGIGFAINGLFMMPIIGLNQGIQPIIGYNFGATQYKRVKETLKLGLTVATSISVLGFIIVMFFTDNLISIFCNNNQQLIHIGTHGLRIVLMMFPFLGLQILGTSYFQAVGKPKQALVLTLSRQVLLLIPLLLILPKFFYLDGIWMSQPISDIFSSTLAVIFLVHELKILHQKQTQKEALPVLEEA